MRCLHAGLDEETIRQIAGLKGLSKHESAADKNTHFTPAAERGRFIEVNCEDASTELAAWSTASSLSLHFP